MKIFMFFINAIFWIWLFIVPAGILGFIAVWLYVKSSQNLVYSIIIGLVGVITGIILAEHVRKKYGLDNFFGRLRATPDIDGGNILDERLNKSKDSSKSRSKVKN